MNKYKSSIIVLIILTNVGFLNAFKIYILYTSSSRALSNRVRVASVQLLLPQTVQVCVRSEYVRINSVHFNLINIIL